jgi:hypothetical protein
VFDSVGALWHFHYGAVSRGFYRALLAAEVRVVLTQGREQTVIRLPGGEHWPDMNSSDLFVRDFYRPLWESESAMAEGKSKHESKRKFVVLGTRTSAQSLHFF